MSGPGSAEVAGTENLVGGYQLLARWARGGMADVYVGRKRGAAGFDKLLAVKILRPELAESEEFREMFYAEARTAALLSHSGIVQTFDVGADGEHLFMAMEFVHGETLSLCHRAIRKAEKPFPAPLAADIIRQVAEALHYAHTRADLKGNALELVHRDVTPGNIMLTHEGGVKLLDFGIAKVATAANVTRAGMIKGKFAYMAPEQASGKPVDHRADVFSLGTVLWQLLTGRRAFRGSSDVEVLAAVINTTPPPPSTAGADCDATLDRIVMRALARDRADRYASAKELAEDLAAYVSRKAPGYSSTRAIRELMATHFVERSQRLNDVLDRADAIEVGRLVGQIPSIPAPSIASASRSSAVMPSRIGRPSVRLGLAALVGVLVVVGISLALRSGADRSISIVSEPSGATVLINGQESGTTPTQFSASSDREVRIRVQRQGYEEWDQVLEPGSEADTVRARLKRAEAYGSLVVDTDPSGATLIVDGEEHEARTPTAVSGLWTGESHSLLITLDGYEPLTEQMELSDHAMRRLSFTLRPLPAAAPMEVAEVADEGPEALQREGQPVAPLGTGRAAPRRPRNPAGGRQAAPAPLDEEAHVFGTDREEAVGPPAETVTPVPVPVPRVAAPTPPPRAQRPVASLGNPIFNGAIDNMGVRSALRRARGAIQNCYAAAYAQSPFVGVLNVRMVINGRGRASADVSGSGGSTLASCVRTAIAGRSYPAASVSDVIVTVPIRLQQR